MMTEHKPEENKSRIVSEGKKPLNKPESTGSQNRSEEGKARIGKAMESLRKQRRKLNFFYILHITFITLLIVILSGIFAFFLAKLFNFKDMHLAPIMMFFIWFIVSTSVAHMVLYHKMKRIFEAIAVINDATEQVAQGDFTVRVELDERVQIDEFKELYTSFNQMVEELGTIETLRDDFVADVSHEFKTPIAAINGYATLLQDRNLTEEERMQHVESILYNCKRLTALTGNILMLSKLDNGTTYQKKQPFRLDEQIRRIVLAMEEDWTKKDLELDIEMDPVTYIGDEDLLYHIWVNLISNAIKFSNKGGLLQIRLEDNAAGTGVVCATIRDSGVGIRADQINHIYDKFYQGDRSRKKEGNGLGLALVKQIANLCGISISVNSKQGHGTTFILELPTETCSGDKKNGN